MLKHDKYHPNYKKMYPGIKEGSSVLITLRKSDRKMEYFEVDLKVERMLVHPKAEKVIVIPAREDSYERLSESKEFGTHESSTEDLAIRQEQFRALHAALECLCQEDAELIKALFFRGESERSYAREIGLSQKGINKRKKRALDRLKELLRDAFSEI